MFNAILCLYINFSMILLLKSDSFFFLLSQPKTLSYGSAVVQTNAAFVWNYLGLSCIVCVLLTDEVNCDFCLLCPYKDNLAKALERNANAEENAVVCRNASVSEGGRTHTHTQLSFISVLSLRANNNNWAAFCASFSTSVPLLGFISQLTGLLDSRLVSKLQASFSTIISLESFSSVRPEE